MTESLLFANIDIVDLVQNIHIGPQAEVLESIEDFNERYIKTENSTRRYWNLQADTKPLGITKKFYWRPGAYDTIKDILWNQGEMHKKAGSLSKVVDRVKTNGAYRYRSLYNDIISIENQLQSFRNSGLMMQDNTDDAVEVWELIKHHIGEQYAGSSNSFSPLISPVMRGDTIIDYMIELHYKYFHPTIEYTHSDSPESLASIEVPIECTIKIRLPLSKWMNILIKSKFRINNIDRRLVRYKRYNNSNWSFDIRGKVIGDYFLMHPFISNGNYYENNPSADDRYVCVGNLESEITHCIASLDFISLKIFLDRLMLHYDTNTGPLNRITQSFHGRPNFLDNCDEYNTINPTQTSDSGRGCGYAQHIEDMELDWIENDSYCSKYCTIKNDCTVYKDNTKQLNPEEVERKAIEQATIQLARGGNR